MVLPSYYYCIYSLRVFDRTCKDHDLEISRWNTFEVDEETGATNIPGIFAGGDIVTGPDIAIRAVAGGKKAALGIDKFLRSK